MPEWLLADSGRTIVYHLYRNARLRFTMTLNASQLRTAIGSYLDGPHWPKTGYTNPVTRLIDGARTEVFLSKWAPYVSVVDEHLESDVSQT